jgi:hypothetical protein
MGWQDPGNPPIMLSRVLGDGEVATSPLLDG